ncbi:hypothetical protein PAHAL_4G297200 [Panicum hallii]|jgi:hypothetical protein|uniref:Dof-type domain-containing protein n=1 Tax=Panicum hallii TaxID=206008 RepID=A0A2T8JEE6_9POAL|nr:hypothetical protein PAHAL_4G297200 [Panicum hallii]
MWLAILKMKTLINCVTASFLASGPSLWGIGDDEGVRQIERSVSCGCCLVLDEMQCRPARKEFRRKRNGCSNPYTRFLSTKKNKNKKTMHEVNQQSKLEIKLHTASNTAIPSGPIRRAAAAVALFGLVVKA